MQNEVDPVTEIMKEIEYANEERDRLLARFKSNVGQEVVRPTVRALALASVARLSPPRRAGNDDSFSGEPPDKEIETMLEATLFGRVIVEHGCGTVDISGVGASCGAPMPEIVRPTDWFCATDTWAPALCEAVYDDTREEIQALAGAPPNDVTRGAVEELIREARYGMASVTLSRIVDRNLGTIKERLWRPEEHLVNASVASSQAEAEK